MYIEIPEYIVKQAAEDCADDENNGFLRCLKAAELYKEANMTPMFLLDRTFQDLVVVAKETFKQKLQ
jgi:hypothetical protein